MEQESVNPIPLALFGVPIHNVTFASTVQWCLEHVDRREPSVLVTANLDFLVLAWRDPEMQRILLEADLVVADGMPLVWISRFFGPVLRERVTGSDMTPRLAAAAARHGASLFLLGAAPGVAETAGRRLQADNPGLRIAGTHSPPLASLLEMDNEPILAALREARPDVLLVAFGAPKQEKWINMHRRTWDIPVAMGIGASLDFLAGRQIRAPRLLQRVGLEWFWRMLVAPRLVKRYIKDFSFLFGGLAALCRLRVSPGGTLAARLECPDDLRRFRARWVPLPPLADGAAAAAFVAATPTGSASLVVDLAERNWLSSVELGALIHLAKHTRRNGHALLLANVLPRVARLLTACRLAGYLPAVTHRQQLFGILERLEAEEAEGQVQLDTEAGEFRLLLPSELTASNSNAYRGRIVDQWAPDGLAVVVDAANCTFLDSTGLGLLIEIRQRAKADGRPIRFIGFHGAALATLRIARLDKALLGQE